MKNSCKLDDHRTCAAPGPEALLCQVRERPAQAGLPFSLKELTVNVIPSQRDVPADSILTGMTAPTEFVSLDPAANLVIEDLDEFAPGIVLPSPTGADYVIGTALSSAYN
jgi:hypothetical protein